MLVRTRFVLTLPFLLSVPYVKKDRISVLWRRNPLFHSISIRFICSILSCPMYTSRYIVWDNDRMTLCSKNYISKNVFFFLEKLTFQEQPIFLPPQASKTRGTTALVYCLISSSLYTGTVQGWWSTPQLV
jgi:hypothetical protein